MDTEVVKEQAELQVEEAAKQAGGFFRSRFGIWLLAGISFIESALLVPVVTDPFLVAYILSDRSRAVWGTVVTTVASVIGGIVAYFMAMGFFEFFAQHFLNPETLLEFNTTAVQMAEGTFIITLIGAFTPLPYTLVGLAAGFVGASLWVFILASIIGRGVRYAIVGWFTYKFGEQALAIARQRIMSATFVGLALIALYILIKWLH